MKIIKYFDEGKKSKLVMDIFDEVIGSFYYPWPLDSIEVYISDSEKCDVFLEDNIGRIFISKKNQFVREHDKKGIKALVLYKLFSLILKLQGYDYNKIDTHLEKEKEILSHLDDFLVSRKSAKQFPDIIFYKKFQELSKIDIDNFSNWFKANLSWLTFNRIDNYYEQYLKDLVRKKSKVKYDNRFFELIKKLIKKQNEYEIESVRKIILEFRRSDKFKF